MDDYIKNFTVDMIETKIAVDIKSCVELFEKCHRDNDFKLIHMNIRSIKKNLDEFKILLSQFITDFECIVLSETWHIDDLNLYNIPGYNLLYNISQVNQNDGVVVYIKNCINFVYKIHTLGNIGLLEINFSYKNRNFLLSAVYRPPSTCPNQFTLNLNSYLANVPKNHDRHIFVGDININIMENTDISNEYQNILSEVM